MRRVVITAIGVVSPCGLDTASTWSAIREGRSGIAPIELFDASDYATQIAGECTGFDPLKFIEKKRLREGARFIHLAVAASDEVMEQAGLKLEGELSDRAGAIIGVGMCGLEVVEATTLVLHSKGPRRVSPYFIPSTIANLAPGTISMRHGFRASNYTTTSACSSGAHAIGEAFKAIQRGQMDVCITGGAEGTITGLAVAGFNSMRALSKRNDEPQRASRPFDKGRDGFVMGEGAGLMLLEERELAVKRGANIVAEVVGYGASADAFHLSLPAPEGEGAARAMAAALSDAEMNADQVGYLNAHGTSTPMGDMLELQGISTAFGAHARDGLLISSTKSMTGHLLGAAGGLETALSALALRDAVIPPTINLEDVDEKADGYDLVPNEAREAQVDAVLSNSFGFGGTNVSLILKRHA